MRGRRKILREGFVGSKGELRKTYRRSEPDPVLGLFGRFVFNLPLGPDRSPFPIPALVDTPLKVGEGVLKAFPNSVSSGVTLRKPERPEVRTAFGLDSVNADRGTFRGREGNVKNGFPKPLHIYNP